MSPYRTLYFCILYLTQIAMTTTVLLDFVYFVSGTFRWACRTVGMSGAVGQPFARRTAPTTLYVIPTVNPVSLTQSLEGASPCGSAALPRQMLGGNRRKAFQWHDISGTQ